MTTLIMALVVPLLGEGARLDMTRASNSQVSKGFFDSYCDLYAKNHPEHATCSGCTTLELPDGGKCQWHVDYYGKPQCKKIILNVVWKGWTTEPQMCPEKPKDKFDIWKEKGGGQLHFIWWGDGGDKWLKSATANPFILAGAVGDQAKVHYWYDPTYAKLYDDLSVHEGLFTLHPLDAETVHGLAAAANLPGADVWNLVNNLKAKGGNGLACSKNFLSWMVLNSYGGQFFDTTVQILKPDVNQPPVAEELSAFRTALNEPVEHVTLPFSELRSRYAEGKHSKTVFEAADPWTEANKNLNRFAVYFDKEKEYTLLGNPELQEKVAIQPSADGTPMPSPDIKVPSVDVWAIKAPKQDVALKAVVTEFFERARGYGLVDGTEAMIDFPMQLFGRDWEAGIMMDIWIKDANEKSMQNALTMDKKTTIGNHFDVRAVCLKSLSMMSLHAGLARSIGPAEEPEEIRKLMWQRHVIAPATEWGIGHPVVAEWRMVKYSGQTHVA